MRTFRLLVVSVSFALIFSCSLLESSDNPTKSPHENSSLSGYLTILETHNPSLIAALNRWAASVEMANQSGYLPDPRIRYAYFFHEVETRVGPQRHKLGISQTFPWFGKLDLKQDSASVKADALHNQYEALKRKLFYQFKNIYYEYYYLYRSIHVTEENIELLKYIENIARTRYAGGTGKHNDIIKAQVELAKLEDRLYSLYDMRSPLAAKMNALLNRSADEKIPWPREIPDKSIKHTYSMLLKIMNKNSPELKELDSMMFSEKALIDLARKNYYPDFTIGVDYIFTDDAIMPDTPDSGKDPFIGMISINLPIWFSKYASGTEEARKRYDASVGERTHKQNSLTADLKMAHFHYVDSERKINLYRNTLLPKAEQSLSVIQQAFTSGEAGFIDLIDAQRTLLDIELAYERAMTDRASRIAEIEMIIGKDITGNENNNMAQ